MKRVVKKRSKPSIKHGFYREKDRNKSFIPSLWREKTLTQKRCSKKPYDGGKNPTVRTIWLKENGLVSNIEGG